MLNGSAVPIAQDGLADSHRHLTATGQDARYLDVKPVVQVVGEAVITLAGY